MFPTSIRARTHHRLRKKIFHISIAIPIGLDPTPINGLKGGKHHGLFFEFSLLLLFPYLCTRNHFPFFPFPLLAMNLKKISQSNLSFDPLKPIILRGPPTEESKTVLSGNVVLTLSKSTKISNIAVTFKCTATTYWPEGTFISFVCMSRLLIRYVCNIGIGVRGTRLTSEKVLSEETLVLMNETKYLSEGVHRLPFGFLVPNVSKNKGLLDDPITHLRLFLVCG